MIIMDGCLVRTFGITATGFCGPTIHAETLKELKAPDFIFLRSTSFRGRDVAHLVPTIPS